MISIEVNGEKFEAKEGSKLKDVLDLTKSFHIPGTTIGILKVGEKKEEATSEYKIFTSKGELRIELVGDQALWNKFSHLLVDMKAHWETHNSIAFGPVETDILIERVEKKFNRYDVFCGTGGYDARNSYLMFAKDKHISDYGSPGMLLWVRS